PRVAGRPLRPATRHRLGRPLPHQLADRPRAPPRAVALSSFLSSPSLAAREPYPVLALLSKGYPGLRDRSPTCYSPVRHSVPQRVTPPRHRVRLACVKYAASVRSEPGSNSLSSSPCSSAQPIARPGARLRSRPTVLRTSRSSQ